MGWKRFIKKDNFIEFSFASVGSIVLLLVMLWPCLLFAGSKTGFSLDTGSTSEGQSTTLTTIECKISDGKTLIDFEGVGNNVPVGDAYAACGVYFSSDALGIIDSDAGGTGNFANEPSPNTALYFLYSDRATLNFPTGLVGGFSFYYTAIYNPGFIRVYAEEDRQGELLATLELPVTPSLGKGDPNGDFDNWKNIGVPFDGIAKSIGCGSFTTTSFNS